MRQASFFWRLYTGYVAIIILVAALVGLFVGRQLAKSSLEEIDRSLRRTALVLRETWPETLNEESVAVMRARMDRLRLDFDGRVTLIDPDGTVLADTHRDAETMENHRERPEVVQARRHGIGEARRFSDTLGANLLYVAIPVPGPEGGIRGYVRSSLPVSAAQREIDDARLSVLIAATIAAILALIGGYVFARRTTGPLRAMTSAARAISEGRYSQNLPTSSTDEIGTLATAFSRMATNLRQHVADIEASRNKIVAILGAMKEGVIAVDQDGHVVHMNQAAGSMAGVDAEDCLGNPAREVIGVQEVVEALSRTLHLRQGIEGELRLPGVLSDRVFELQSSVLLDTNGELVGAVVVLHDASELRRLEGVRQDFVSNVSHELKTPVAAIRGLVESILDDPEMEGEIRTQFLTRVSQQCTRLTALVTDLLSLSAAEDRRTLDRGQVVDLRDPLRGSVNSHTPPLEAKDLNLEVDFGQDILSVRADTETLRLIFDNLISNAIRYTPSEGRLWIRARVERSHAVVEVQDTGIGIEPKHQERIFERFYRVDKARSRELGGTGLGLAIVKHLVLALDGEIRLESTPGEGTCFMVRIPLANPMAVPAA